MDTASPDPALTPEEFAAVSRAVAEPRRFSILQQIAGTSLLPCTSLHARSCLSPATISHHLKELQEAKLITIEREGRGVRLSLRREVWRAYLKQLAALETP